LARALESRARDIGGGEPTTGDTDIARRRWFLVDVDPVRPSGISSTEAGHAAALALASVIRDTLVAEGWPMPIVGDSGIGAARCCTTIDLPADDKGLVERCLKALAFRFDDDRLSVDEKVYNPARIWKLYGTWAAKGDSTSGSTAIGWLGFLEVPDKLVMVTVELLQQLAASGPVDEVDELAFHVPHNGNGSFDLDEWVQQYCREAVGPTNWRGGRKWVAAGLPVGCFTYKPLGLHRAIRQWKDRRRLPSQTDAPARAGATYGR
jgi:hypothetical protein